MSRGSAMSGQWHLATALALLLQPLVSSGCSTYREKPLSPEAVEQALAPPPPSDWQVRIADLHHPRLAAISIDPAGPFSPDQLAVLAVVINPGLRARRAERALAEAQVVQAGILPNPQLSLGTDLAVSSPAGDATRGSSLGLGWDFTSLITRGAKRDAALAHVEQVALDIAWQEWLIAEGTKQAAFRVAGAQQRLALTQALEQVLGAQQQVMSRAFALGMRTRLDEVAAALAAADAHRQTLDAESEIETHRLALNRLLGLPPERAVAVQVVQWPTTIVWPPRLTEDIQHQRLDLLALRCGYESQEASLRAAVLGQFPRISINLARATDTSKVRTLTLGVAIELPLFDRNQGVIASESATRERLFDEYVERVFAARSDLAQAQAEAAAISRRIADADHTIAGLELHAQDVARAETNHTVDVLTANGIASQVLLRRIDVLTLRQQLAEVRIASELAAGIGLAPLVSNGPGIPVPKERP